MKHSIHMIHMQQPTNYLSVLDHFVGLALKGLNAQMCSFKTSDLNRSSKMLQVSLKCPLKSKPELIKSPVS